MEHIPLRKYIMQTKKGMTLWIGVTIGGSSIGMEDMVGRTMALVRVGVGHIAFTLDSRSKTLWGGT